MGVQATFMEAVRWLLWAALTQSVAALTCGPYSSTSLTRKDTSVVCIEYDFTGDGTADSFGVFHPKVDVFSSYQVNEVSSGDFWNNSTNSTAKIRAVVGTQSTGW